MDDIKVLKIEVLDTNNQIIETIIINLEDRTVDNLNKNNYHLIVSTKES